MIEGLLTILTSSGLGAIVGAVGGWMGKRENRLLKELEFDHDIKMSEIESQQMTLEFNHAVALADKQIEQTETEGDIATDIAETKAFTQGLKIQQIKSGSSIVDAIRFLMRPVITVYLLGISTYFAYSIHQLVEGIEILGITQLVGMYTQIISQIFFLTITCVSWWFSSRGDKFFKSK
jgi:hypothetical protein